MTVLESAGFDVVLVETVGVGQSEITVAGMVDTFVFLTIARTGDQLQGIKKGILEIADVIAVNKADGERRAEAEATSKDLAGALRLVYAGTHDWVPPVLTCSALEGTGIDTVWSRVIRHREFMGQRGPARASGPSSSSTSRGRWCATSSTSGCATTRGSRRCAPRSARRCCRARCPPRPPPTRSSRPTTDLSLRSEQRAPAPGCDSIGR